jgi:thiosulfate reductase/polysulfide reductase chain A
MKNRSPEKQNKPQGRCEQPSCESCNSVTTVCYMCSSECGLQIHERDGQVVGLFGDTGNPMNRGTLCPKAFGTSDLLSKDRIKTPLRRVGARGEGRFEPISWETALHEIAQRLVHHKKTEGPQSLLVQFGEKPDHDMVYRFANAYGTPNVLDHDSICDTNRRQGFMFTYGSSHFRPLPDLNRPIQTTQGVRKKHDCRYLLLIGENPMEATRFLFLRNGILAALQEGLHLTVVDPFRSATARLAHDWLSLRPGSDLALVLALLRFVIEHDQPGSTDQAYLDHDFIRDWTVDFDALQAQLLEGERYSLDWAAEQTGLSAETIKRIAHEFGSTKPAAAMVGMNGVGHHHNGFLTTRAVAMLVAITGNLDVPGGVALAPRATLATDRVYARHLLTQSLSEMHKDIYAGYPLAYSGIKAKDPQDILDGVELTHGMHAGKKYRIRSLFVIHGNPVINAPASAKWREALTRKVDNKDKTDSNDGYLLDLLVFNDTMLNDTSLYADYILPMASYIERQGVCRPYVNEPTVSLRRPVVPLQHQSRTPLDWLRDLSEACYRSGDADMDGVMKYQSDDEWCNELLLECPGIEGYENGVAPDGSPLNVKKLIQQGGTISWPARYRKYDGLDTPSGKVELSSRVIEAANREFGYNYEPMLSYQHNAWSGNNPDYAHYRNEYPFQLITGRSLAHTGSFTQNLPKSLKMMSAPRVWMNQKDANKLVLQEGDRVVIRNPYGAKIVAHVSPTDDLLEGVVRAQHGWGQRSPHLKHARGRGYNINELTDDQQFNDITGNASFGDMMVAIERDSSDQPQYS